MAKSLFFVDRRVSDYQKLLAGFPEGIEIYLLDLDRDGLTQIADYLAGYGGLDSIQIISHGSSGALYLGSTMLDGDNLFNNTDALCRIGQALTESGDILLYGCNVAQGDTGRDFITNLSNLTSAEVAASIDPTGAANQGGNWDLEAYTGPIETDGRSAPDYHGLLDMSITSLHRSFPGARSGEFRNNSAFAALLDDGSVVTWGDASTGGDSSTVAAALNGTNDVSQVFSTGYAFAALRVDGSVVTWGDAYAGGNSSSVATKLNGSIDVTNVFSTWNAFAALRVDGSVVTWGETSRGGDSSSVATALNGSIDVTQVFSSPYAFAALRSDGSVVTWGGTGSGGDSSSVAAALNGDIDVTQVFSTELAFAALRADGSVVTWGDASFGGDSSSVATELDGAIDVTQVFSTGGAFAALRADGSVVTWGDASSGGNSSSVATKLNGNIDATQLCSTWKAFAALRADGSVVTWGDADYGGNSSSVATKLNGSIDVTQAFSTWFSFAALRADGSVVTWGGASYGGNSSAVATKINGSTDVTHVFSSLYAFAALRADGSVVTWGDASSGGDSSSVATKLNGNTDVTVVFDTDKAFAALRADGTVITWGDPSTGGDSSSVASQLTNVVSMANPYTDDVYLAPDTTPPTAASFNPVDEAFNVAVGSNIMVTFSEAIQRGSGNIVLKTAAGNTVATYSAADSSNLTISGNVLTINPSADLAPGTDYKVEFAAGTIEDLAGNSYVGTTNYNFTTADIIAPTVTSFSPADEATGIAIDSNIVVTFSETIRKGTGDIVFKTTAGTTVATYNVGSFSVAVSGNTLTINPSADLAPGTDYKVEFAAGTIKDLAGNSYAGTTSYNFTTAYPPPPVAPKLITNGAFNFLVDPQMTMQTNMGTVVFELNPEKAPITVANMLAYVNSGFYDNTLFHKVVPGVYLQGGAFATGMNFKTPTYNPIALESSPGMSNLRGTIFMARSDVADSATSQFNINLVDNTYWDYSSPTSPGYAVFGKVVSGLPVIDSIAQVPTTTVGPYENVPVTEVIITSLQQTLAGSCITNAATLTLGNQVLGAQWSYSLDDGATWTAGTDNSFVVPVGNYAAGAIEVRQYYAAGNMSSSGTLPYALVVETTVPTVTGFSPADEAGGVAIDGNIVVTLSEPIQRGSGNIVLKNAAGVTVATYNAAGSNNLTFSGNTLTIDPTAELLPASTYQVQIAAGAIQDLAGNSYAGTTVYNFTTAIYTSYPGTAGSDTFTGGVNNDLMNGGAGLDNAIFSGNRQGYTIIPTTGGCRLSGTGWGTDTLTSIERLHFADTNLAWDLAGSAGQVYRLYQAAFARTPDLGGLGGWIGGMDGGMTLLQVAAAFVGSVEFQSLYGVNPSDGQFITQLYLNVLKRAPDAGGFDYWVNQLASSLQSRAEVLMFFSESGENQATVLPAIAGGILYASAEQAAGPARGQNLEGSTLVDILIGTVGNDTFLGGGGDDSIDGGVGLDSAIYEGSRAGHTITRTGAGLTVSGTSDGTDTLVNVERLKFADSALAFDIDGNAGQTYRLYQAAFARTPDTAGLSDWIRGMDSGMTLQNVATGFIGSAEFQGLYGASPTNTEFIDLLYNNVLHRAADQAGYDYWIDQINHGMSREQVLVGFSESEENQLALLGVIQDGIEYIPA